ncbi:MAG TPA: M48 family metallopeptidase [Bacteroidota bacterium]|nr:M48 family metallopeptidase [Bacteroidota bacterium]
MNGYALFIAAALCGEFLLDTAAHLLDLRSLKKPPPENMAGVYPPGEYARSQLYTAAKTRFGMLGDALALAGLFLFWYTGMFNALDLAVRSLGLGPVRGGVVYIGALAFIRSLLGLPFSLYKTFVLEARFGFNRTTFRVFCTDILKGLVLALLLGVPLLAGALALFGSAGDSAWVICWILFSCFMLIVQFAAPRWIMPLFNKFIPLEEGDLRTALFSYALSVGFPIDEIFVMNGSKRSSKANAFFTGFGRHKRIVLYDTLIAGHTTDELKAIVAHEIGHFKKHHILQGMILGVLNAGLMLFLFSRLILLPGLYGAFAVDHPSAYTGFIFAGLFLTPLGTVISLFLHSLSRANEFAADRYAAVTTGDAQSLIAALKKLSAENLTNLTPHPLMVRLHHSHPPVPERISSLERPSGT